MSYQLMEEAMQKNKRIRELEAMLRWARDKLPHPTSASSDDYREAIAKIEALLQKSTQS